MTHPTNDTVRAASYLAAKLRLDARRANTKSGTLKCKPPNRQCGDRCIPPNWKCRLKGEGDDSHSRVVAGDPLAGAAAIDRGRRRLLKGLATGNLTEIQAGRAAISRGIVKSVPGQDIKRKNELRRKVDKALLPIATGLFGIWALNRGHEAVKFMVPSYATGIGRDIERAAGTAVSTILDRIPVLGRYRERSRAVGAATAQVLARSAAEGVRLNPEVNANNRWALEQVTRGKLDGVNAAMDTARDAAGRNYERYRAETLAGVVGAGLQGKNYRDPDFKSIYAKPAAAEYLAQRFGLDSSRFRGADDTTKKQFTIDGVKAVFINARDDMRRDMEVRGLSYRKPEDVEQYIVEATRNAARQFQQIRDPNSRIGAVDSFGGTIRELVRPAQADAGAEKIARRLFDEAETSYNNYFRDAAIALEQDLSPTRRVLIPSSNTPVAPSLVASANLLGRKVGIRTPVAGASHAELILRKHFHERAVHGGRFNSTRRGTWTAPDADIKAAARDLGWTDNGNPSAAYQHLRNNTGNDFANLQPPTVGARTYRVSRGLQEASNVSDIARRLRQAATERGEQMSLEASYKAARAEIQRRQQNS